MSAQTFIGIDVSKDKIDICLLRESSKGIYKIFSNNTDGFNQLSKWAHDQSRNRGIHFCMEATGTYHLALATFLFDANELVSVVNPAHIKYSGPQGAKNRTDKASAYKIAYYTRQYSPEAWVAPSQEKRVLVGLVRLHDVLVEERGQHEVRLQTPELVEPARKVITQIILHLNEQIKSIEDQINDHIDKNDALKEDLELLKSIPGIGAATASRILAEMPSIENCSSAGSAAAYAGLAPIECQSGTSVHKPTKLSKQGNKYLRRALYFPAMVAIKHNPTVAALAKRLLSRGKAKMAIIGAAMRKLMMLAYGVLKSRQPFNENYSALKNAES